MSKAVRISDEQQLLTIMGLGKFATVVLVTACGDANLPQLLRVEPSELWLDELPRDVLVWGRNLEPSMPVKVDRAETIKVATIQARLDDVVVAHISRFRQDVLTLTVPRDVGAGRHNLSVSLGPGRSAFLSEAVEVYLSRGEDTTSASRSSTEPPVIDASVVDALDGQVTETPDSGPLIADVGALTFETTDDVPLCEWGPFSVPERIGGLEGNGTLWGPAVSTDPSVLVFAMNDLTDERIAYATRVGRVATFRGVTLIPGVNSSGTEGSPFLSADGQTLYFFSTRADNAPTDTAGERDIWRAGRTGGEFTFGNAEALTELNTRNRDQMPWLSDDELTIVFTSDRPSGKGAHDLWQAHRDSITSPFRPATNLSELNTALNEEGASLSTDLLTIFFASGTSADSSDFDIYTATRISADSTFGAATKVTELNSNNQELYAALSHDGRELFFASNRGGASELWRGTRECD